jgi:HNH endonuclease
MKWFRHMADTWDDERIARLVRDGGPEGLACYGLWWRVLEIVARQVNDSDKKSVSYPTAKWVELLALREIKVRDYLRKLELAGLIAVAFDSDEIRVTITVDIDVHAGPDNRPPAHIWNELRSIIFARDNYTCRYCGVRGGNLECDHITPVSLSGSSELSNLVTACYSCNRSKGNKTLEEWLQ